MDIIKNKSITVRQFNNQDIKQLHQLMYELAVFEGYDEQFSVTQESIEQYGLSKNPRFYCFVAHSHNSNHLLGMAVVHLNNWTFDLKPTLVLKELFVKGSARGKNVGQLLMIAVTQHAKQLNAPRIKWLVLKSNDKAKAFYQKLGASKDLVWENWEMDASDIKNLIK